MNCSKLGIVATHITAVGAISFAVGMLAAHLCGVRSTLGGAFLSSIFAGNLAIWYGTRMHGEKHETREWKVRLLIGVFMAVYSSALITAFVASGTFKPMWGIVVGSTCGVMSLASMLKSAYQYKVSSLDGWGHVGREMRFAVPEHLYQLPFIYEPGSMRDTPAEMERRWIPDLRWKDFQFCYSLLHYLKRARNELIHPDKFRVQTYSADDIEFMINLSASRALLKLGFFLLLQNAQVTKREDSWQMNMAEHELREVRLPKFYKPPIGDELDDKYDFTNSRLKLIKPKPTSITIDGSWSVERKWKKPEDQYDPKAFPWDFVMNYKYYEGQDKREYAQLPSSFQPPIQRDLEFSYDREGKPYIQHPLIPLSFFMFTIKEKLEALPPAAMAILTLKLTNARQEIIAEAIKEARAVLEDFDKHLAVVNMIDEGIEHVYWNLLKHFIDTQLEFGCRDTTKIIPWREAFAV